MLFETNLPLHPGNGWFIIDANVAPTCGEAAAIVDSQKGSCVHSDSVAVLSTHLMVSRGGLSLAKSELVSGENLEHPKSSGPKPILDGI